MTFKITAKENPADTDADSMLFGNQIALELISSGIKGKVSGSITIEYVGEQVTPEMGDDLAGMYKEFAEKKYGTSSKLRERG